MKVDSPEEVLRNVAQEFKHLGFTQAEVAKKLGMNSRQSVSNILASKKYMSRKQATKFNIAFEFNVEYLMTGEGTLVKDEYDELPRPQKGSNVSEGLSSSDASLVLSWIHEYLYLKHDADGLEVLKRIKDYIRIPYVVAFEMKDYSGNDYDKVFDQKVNQLRSEITKDTYLLIQAIKHQLFESGELRMLHYPTPL